SLSDGISQYQSVPKQIGGMRLVMDRNHGNNREIPEFAFRETGSEALRHRSHHPSPRPCSRAHQVLSNRHPSSLLRGTSDRVLEQLRAERAATTRTGEDPCAA